MPALYDPVTGSEYSLEHPRWCSESGNPLMVTLLPGLGRAEIEQGRRSLWRYAAALPFSIEQPVSMGEGCTPLIRGQLGGAAAYFKLEWFAPTGSFKDRGASVMISALKQQGVSNILEDSSGNGGAAIAAYAAAAGMRAKILVPAYTPDAKTVQMRAYGADVELVPGTRQDTSDEAIRQSERTFYASHNWHPMFLQGTKTLAYELWEDFGFEAPDNIIIPTGAGSNVLGCEIGFSELFRHGEVQRAPRLFAVQPANCSPLDAAFKAGAADLVDCVISPTIAEGTAIAKPVRAREVLAAIRNTEGQTVAVTEIQILQAAIELAALGVYVEPTCASAAAAFQILLERDVIKPHERTVLILTGAGLKATQAWAQILKAELDGAQHTK